MHRCITLGIEHHLRDPGSIPQIDEHDCAMVAPPLDPAVIELERLIRFVENPTKEFLRGRLESPRMFVEEAERARER